MFASVLMTLIIYVQNAFCGYIERVEISGCESCRLMLTCRQLDSIIAILDTDFKAENSVYDSGLLRNKSMPFPPDHPRDTLNKRCSGLNHCSFILTEDSPGSEAWGAGNITVKYACATRDRVHPYCNSEIKLNEKLSSGMIHNPGYPRFYAGQKRCTWKITAPHYQKLRLRLLDVALFDTRVLSQEDCKDTLEIRDTGQTIYSTCTQEHPPSEVISASESVEVVLTSRQAINPRRGILIYYTTVGCPPPLAPTKGRLMFSNESLAAYSCCKGYVFPDTQTQTRTIKCFGASWNVSLPLQDCEEPQASRAINLQKAVKKTEPMASDLIAPLLVMFLLFGLNSLVIFYIYRMRKNDFKQTRSSKFNIQSERGLLFYGSTDYTYSLRGKSSKSGTKNWALSLKANDERRP